MVISEVIEKLQEIQKEHGDFEVWLDYRVIDESDFWYDNEVLVIG